MSTGSDIQIEDDGLEWWEMPPMSPEGILREAERKARWDEKVAQWKSQERTMLEARRKKPQIIERDGARCYYCGATESLCVDHIVPRARGGTNDLDNLQLLCRSCNSRKGAK